MNISSMLAWFVIVKGLCAVQIVSAQNVSWSSPPSTNELDASSDYGNTDIPGHNTDHRSIENYGCPSCSTVTLVVMLTFSAFSTESCCDKVSLYDGYDASTRRIVQLSGYYSTMLSYYSTQMYMFVNFRTDGSTTTTGFIASYQTINGNSTPKSTSGTDYTVIIVTTSVIGGLVVLAGSTWLFWCICCRVVID